MRTWKILERGDMPIYSPSKAELTCLSCGTVATLPVVGMAIAQVGQGLVFDLGQHQIPKTIQCRTCRKVLEKD